MPVKASRKKAVVSKQSNKIDLTTIIVGAAVAIGGGYGISQWLKNRATAQSSGQLATSNNVQLATSIHTVLENSGMLSFWIPNEYYNSTARLVELAKKIKDWNGVQAQYQTLYGENLTVLLSTEMPPQFYNQFITALSAQGNPTNGSGSGTVVPVTTLKNGDKVKFNAKADSSVVNTYKAWADYPGKPYISLPAGNKTRNAITFLQSVKFKYIGSSVDTVLYQVQMPGFSVPVYVNDYFFTKI